MQTSRYYTTAQMATHHSPSAGYMTVFSGHPHSHSGGYSAAPSSAPPLSPNSGYNRVVYYSGGATWPSMMGEPGQPSPQQEYRSLPPAAAAPVSTIPRQPSPTPSSTTSASVASSLSTGSATSSALPSPTSAPLAAPSTAMQQEAQVQQPCAGGCLACQAQRAAASAPVPPPLMVVTTPSGPSPTAVAGGATVPISPVPLGIGAPGYVSFIPSPTGEVRVLKVSAQSNPKTVAGSIAHNTRAGASPALLATGTPSVNQAIKALAIARGYLREADRIDFVCSASLRDDERPAVSFGLHKTALVGAPEPGAIELRVASTSESHVVAGSIAKKLRAGNRIFLVAIGATSVVQTVKAIVVARRYLERDRIDITFQPEFIKVEAGDGQRSALKLSIFAHHFRS